ncbi:MAG: 30S ribosomal protein S1 [Elusimicrobia bacterium CG11_big_fil_rev_8_21_14_0_20_64_6]|nr:MAG: 30S ribosomal protein S1 [Elusimicrobia bacterium CG11_big_fil_rev_8_21_14_0_20_64_6]
MKDSQDQDSDSVGEQSTEDFSALLGASLEAADRIFSVGDVVRGEILSVGREDSQVALGPGREGVVATADFRDAEGLVSVCAGDALDLYVTSVRSGQIRLSKNPTDINIAQDLKEAFELKRPVEGRVIEACKGGFRVSIKGKAAFCPVSQIDVKRTETGAEFVGKTFTFVLTEFGEGGRSVVVSRRKLLEEEQGRASDAFLSANPDGAVVAGTVVRLEKFGAFIELVPGVEGLLHVSEVAWSRVASPEEILAIGQPVSVKILKRETVDGRLKVSLSLKQVTERPPTPQAPAVVDPWSKYAAGQVVEGKITRKEPYGLFVQLEPGVVGLLHQSKTGDRPEFQLERQKVGDAISVQVAEVRLDERRISLELPRDENEDEWRKQQEAAAPPAGAMAEVLRAALEKKKR